MRLTPIKLAALMLLLPACGALLTLGLFYSFHSQTSADGPFINLAGRQRMLSQQLLHYSAMVQQGHDRGREALRRSAAEFDRSLAILEHGGEILDTTLPPAPPQIAAQLKEVKQLWSTYLPALHRIAGMPTDDPEMHRAYEYVQANNGHLTAASNRMVTVYQARSQALRSRTFDALIAVAGLDIVLLLAGIWATKDYLNENKSTEEALRKSEDQWRRTFDSITDLVSLHDQNFRIVKANKAVADFFGKRPEDLIGKRCYEVFHGSDRPWNTCPHVQTLRHRDTVSEEIDDPHMGCPMQVTTSPVFDEYGQVIASVHIAKDITLHKQTEERLQYLAHYDHLTSLPNRTLFFDRLNQALARARWHRRLLAVLFLDIDRFKVINDSLGHDAGDRLLQIVGQRLAKTVREGDTVARLGGDEFAIMLGDVAKAHDIPKVAKAILKSLSQALFMDDRELFTTASIGISVYPDDGDQAAVLVRNADIAMYHAKERGKNNYQFYSPRIRVKAPERLVLENSLRHALERGEFLLHYQPRVDLGTGQITGMEALVRWQHPEMGILAPEEFIPLLEETGLIVPVGEWILRAACAQNQAWQESGLPPMRIGVNLSPRQFKQQDLATTVTRTLNETGLNPRYLELELTESILMEHTDETLLPLRTLSGLGINLTLDDFGIGYSSLGYLKRFPIDVLKIDRSFVRDITVDPNDAAIAQAVIAMAHSLGMRVVAEGVESKEQLAFLQVRQCDEMQGFYFSRPLPADEFARLITQGRGLPHTMADTAHPNK